MALILTVKLPNSIWMSMGWQKQAEKEATLLR